MFKNWLQNVVILLAQNVMHHTNMLNVAKLPEQRERKEQVKFWRIINMIDLYLAIFIL